MPPKAGRFAVLVSGDGGECVSASVVDPSGKTIWSDGCVAAWSGAIVEAGAAEGLWTLELGKPEKGHFEDERVDLAGIPGYLFLDPTRYWKVR